MKTLKKFPLLIVALVLLSSAAAAQENPAGTGASEPIVAYQSKFPIALEGRDYDFLTMVIDFPTGAGFPKHYHGGHVLVTVLSGELTLQQGGGQKVVKTGESWTENPGDQHSVVNKGPSARVTASMLLPRGTAVTTFIK